MGSVFKKLSMVVCLLSLVACASQPTLDLETASSVAIEKGLVGQWECAASDESGQAATTYRFVMNADHTYTDDGELYLTFGGGTAVFVSTDKGEWSLNEEKQVLLKSAGFIPLEIKGEQTSVSRSMLSMLNELIPASLEAVDYISTLELISIGANEMVLNDITPVRDYDEDVKITCSR